MNFIFVQLHIQTFASQRMLGRVALLSRDLVDKTIACCCPNRMIAHMHLMWVWDKKGPNRSMFPIVPEFFTSNVWNFEFKLGN
jgi:hypothetical protein